MYPAALLPYTPVPENVGQWRCVSPFRAVCLYRVWQPRSAAAIFRLLYRQRPEESLEEVTEPRQRHVLGDLVRSGRPVLPWWVLTAQEAGGTLLAEGQTAFLRILRLAGEEVEAPFVVGVGIKL